MSAAHDVPRNCDTQPLINKRETKILSPTGSPGGKSSCLKLSRSPQFSTLVFVSQRRGGGRLEASEAPHSHRSISITDGAGRRHFKSWQYGDKHTNRDALSPPFAPVTLRCTLAAQPFVRNSHRREFPVHCEFLHNARLHDQSAKKPSVNSNDPILSEQRDVNI